MTVGRTRLLACLGLASAMSLLGCIPGTAVHTARWSLQASALPPTANSGDCQVRISSDYFGGLQSYIQRTQLVDETAFELRARFMKELLAHSEVLTSGQSISATTSFLDTHLAPNPLPPRAEAQPLQIYVGCLTEEGYFRCGVPMANGLRSAVVCPFTRFQWEARGVPTSIPAALDIDYTATHCTRAQGDCGRGWFIRIHQLRTVEAQR